jgi:hypothetical protein
MFDPTLPLRAAAAVMASQGGASSQLLESNAPAGSQRRFMPLWEAPDAWLQLLFNNPLLLNQFALQTLMSVSWAMCRAVLRCMRRWRLTITVRSNVVQLSCE